MNESNSNVVTPQALIDRFGISTRQWVIFGLLFLLLVSDGMDITIVSHVFPSLVREWGAESQDITLIVTMSFVGMGAGALVAGRLADRFGRKPVILGSVLLLGISTIMVGTSTSVDIFLFWRVISSLGLGGVMPVILTLLADLARREIAANS